MTAPPPAPRSGVETRPLTDPVSAADIRRFTAELRAQGRLAAGFRGANAIGLVVFLVVAGLLAVMFLSSAVGALGAVIASGRFRLTALVPVLVVAAVLALVVVLVVRFLRGGRVRWYRLARFADANGMSYAPQVDAPRLPGVIFGQGRDRVASDALRGQRPRFVEIANYRYTTGSGKRSTTHRWGYVAIKLDTPLPHILLDATGNNGLFGSNLPVAFDRDQRLGLEGDFDRYFSLYCPRGYERDALYLFTPDIMARFIDNAAELDVEIVDDWLFLYAKRDLSTLDPATWAWVFSVIGALQDKLAQWARWRDERLETDAAAHGGTASSAPGGPAPQLRPPPGVAAQGRRLRRGIPILGILAAAAVIVFWAVSLFI